MHDPASPSSSSEPADEISRRAPADVVEEVMAWYSRAILAERRAPNSSPERLEQLLAQRQECVRDRARLEEADAEETARITASYAARLRELGATGP
ncbi:hypothetical protein GCM10010363_69960 [Streptomyces omiyaensis]|uniref:hypothetical protein n=1 Tax=Streptomyces omiyaensis TaxID=68247 RepID=UPI00199FDCC8|nr:hypothetical protein [Streptomyces omiyaensis]GGY79025.1 hypothetical protein GCM10010363_69960 [Streptomyces omiyaensis]